MFRNQHFRKTEKLESHQNHHQDRQKQNNKLFTSSYIPTLKGQWKTKCFEAKMKGTFESVLIYTRIAKPFSLLLQIFATITFNTTFSKNCSENEGIWGRLLAPVAANSEKKHVHFPYVNSKVYWFTQGSPNLLFYRCIFSPLLKQKLLFAKLQRESPQLRETGGSRRRQ